jgi:tetracycline resistance efflux pump
MKKNYLISGVVLVMVVILAIFSFRNPGQIADPETYTCAAYATVFSLLPPVIAIVLALITKEVYSSLFIGIVAGGILYANGNLELTLNTIFFQDEGGMVACLSSSSHIGILIFLVILGILVALMNRTGGSAAFGRWASRHIRSRVGAQLATAMLGVLIFVDDYFNCLTVGSVMRPVTDRHQVSRAKLAYLIDATAAPVCIIAPISSWAAAVTSSVPEGSDINGFTMFLQTIPFNFYALTTLVMIVILAVRKIDFGPMATHETNAIHGDLYTTDARPYGDDSAEEVNPNGRVLDLVFPVVVLIISCVIGMIYTGGFFDGVDFITAFSKCDASRGLVLGSSVTLIISFVYYMFRGVLRFEDFTACIPDGFKAMVAPILILSMAWTLSGITGLLGADIFVKNLVENSAQGLQALLPCIIFLVALFLAFATGTSWGTFGILIPIVCNAFPSGTMLTISIAACLSGAVCGDHCSPISDTTIMASAGAHCDHVNHVSTQLPYAMTAAVVSFIGYLIAGLTHSVWISLPVTLVLLVAVLLVLQRFTHR